MLKELKLFFEKIKDDKNLFLFWRLYQNPNSVLGDKQDMDEAEEEYNNLHDYCELMMNNNLTEFIELVLKDKEFGKKANIQTWRKFNFFLYDSADFKKYHALQFDNDLLKTFKEEMTIIEYLDKKGLPHTKGSIIGLMGGYDIYKKFIRLFEHNYSKEQVESYDENRASSLRSWVNLRIEAIKERTIDKEDDKKSALKRILEEDYSKNIDYDNMYLYRYQLKSDFIVPYTTFPGICFTALDDLVCENRFLDVMQQLLEQGQINGIPLDNAIQIINMGVEIKSYKEPDAIFFRKRLGDDLVKEFDIKRAETLISELTLYKIKKERQHQLTKVISFASVKKHKIDQV
jgi:hypothetical protein